MIILFPGELLKERADDGVKVLILVWNEVTSTPLTAGLMGTHDQETLQYFAGSRVCLIHSTILLLNFGVVNLVQFSLDY